MGEAAGLLVCGIGLGHGAAQGSLGLILVKTFPGEWSQWRRHCWLHVALVPVWVLLVVGIIYSDLG